MAKGKKQAAPTKKKPSLAKRFKCPFCANGEFRLDNWHEIRCWHGVLDFVTSNNSRLCDVHARCSFIVVVATYSFVMLL